MKKRTVIIALTCIGAVGAGLNFSLLNKAGAALPNHPVTTVTRMDLEDVVSSLGKLEPATYVDVGAQISGQLLALHVELGSPVEKGELLAEIDPRTYETKVEADKATLANLQATLAERQATLTQAKRNHERDQELRRQNAGSALSAQTSETEYKVAQAQTLAVEAQIRQAEASLANDELNLAYCKIYAPISGTVVSLPVKEGQTLNSNQNTPTLMRIAELDVMTVWAQVSEADINKLDPGMDVYFTTVGDNSNRYYAKVDKIHPSYTEDNDVILYDVVFNIENSGGKFLPAMNTQVFFIRSQARAALAIPMESLSTSQKNTKQAVLTVVLPDGREESRDVTLGVRTRTAVEVISGLSEGEKILIAAKVEAPGSKGGAALRDTGPKL